MDALGKRQEEMVPAEGSRKEVSEAINEYRDREYRKCNIILHNVPESSKEDGKDRKADDVKWIETLGNDLECTITIKEAIRLGKKRHGKPRLLKVILDSVRAKRNMLMETQKLRNGKEEYKNIYITPDQTLREREANKLLRSELKRRTDQGEPNLIIKNGRISTKETVVDGAAARDEVEQAAQPFRAGAPSQ